MNAETRATINMAFDYRNYCKIDAFKRENIFRRDDFFYEMKIEISLQNAVVIRKIMILVNMNE